MKNFDQYITDIMPQKDNNINEVVGVLLASSVLCWTCKPLLKGVGDSISAASSRVKNGDSVKDIIFGKSDKKNSGDKSSDEKSRKKLISKLDDSKDKLNGLKNNLSDAKNEVDVLNTELEKTTDKTKRTKLISKLEKAKKKRDETEKKITELEKNISKASSELQASQNKSNKDIISTKDLNKSLIVAKKANKNTKDSKEKEQNEKLIKVLSASSYDKDGNEVPAEKRGQILTQLLSKDELKDLKSKVDKDYEKIDNKKEFSENIKKAKNNISSSELEEFTKTAKAHAKEKKLEIPKEEPKKEESKKEEPKKEESKKEEPKKEESKKEEPKKEESKKEEPKKDKDGNVIKQEVVKDPKTGEKKKVVTHTGPRGGKFYYPEGKPKKPENKVYVESISLKDYLIESID